MREREREGSQTIKGIQCFICRIDDRMRDNPKHRFVTVIFKMTLSQIHFSHSTLFFSIFHFPFCIFFCIIRMTSQKLRAIQKNPRKVKVDRPFCFHFHWISNSHVQTPHSFLITCSKSQAHLFKISGSFLFFSFVMFSFWVSYYIKFMSGLTLFSSEEQERCHWIKNKRNEKPVLYIEPHQRKLPFEKLVIKTKTRKKKKTITKISHLRNELWRSLLYKHHKQKKTVLDLTFEMWCSFRY